MYGPVHVYQATASIQLQGAQTLGLFASTMPILVSISPREHTVRDGTCGNYLIIRLLTSWHARVQSGQSQQLMTHDFMSAWALTALLEGLEPAV